MFTRYFINKYIQGIQEELMQDDFVDIFLDSDILGYSDSEFDEDTYFKLLEFLEIVYNKIIINKDFKKLIFDGDGYLIPYPTGWIKIHEINNKPKGFTFYFSKYTYKLFLNDYTKTVSLNALEIAKPRYANRVSNNLKLI